MKPGKTIVSFFVPGNPLPKQSARFSRKGPSYTPKRIMDWERTVRDAAKIAMTYKGDQLNGALTYTKTTPPYEGTVHVDFRFLRDNRRRVDIGNLEKAVGDAMNGVVYRDDSQIKSMRLTLGYDKENPGVWVEVRELE